MASLKNGWWLKIGMGFLCAHFIEIIGREESTLELLLQPFYYKDTLSGTVIGWTLLEYLSRIADWLDKRYDWTEQTIKRLLLQVWFGVFICAMLAYSLVNLQFRFVLNQRMEDTTWLYYEFPFVVLLIVMINLGYVTYYFIARAKVSESNTSAIVSGSTVTSVDLVEKQVSLAPINRQVLRVRKGSKTIPIMVEELAYIFKKGDYNYARSFHDETYMIDKTLEELEQQLEDRNFFRANRQTIISLRSCKSFTAEAFGKLKVSLNPPSLEHVIVSQKNAPLFKKWIDR